MSKKDDENEHTIELRPLEIVWGKLVDQEGGMERSEHQLTSMSRELSSEALEVCEPKKLLPHKGELQHSIKAAYKDCGLLVMRPVRLRGNDGSAVDYVAVMRAARLAGERSYFQSTVWLFDPKEWSINLLPAIAEKLVVTADLIDRMVEGGEKIEGRLGEAERLAKDRPVLKLERYKDFDLDDEDKKRAAENQLLMSSLLAAESVNIEASKFRNEQELLQAVVRVVSWAPDQGHAHISLMIGGDPSLFHYPFRISVVANKVSGKRVSTNDKKATEKLEFSRKAGRIFASNQMAGLWAKASEGLDRLDVAELDDRDEKNVREGWRDFQAVPLWIDLLLQDIMAFDDRLKDFLRGENEPPISQAELCRFVKASLEMLTQTLAIDDKAVTLPHDVKWWKAWSDPLAVKGKLSADSQRALALIPYIWGGENNDDVAAEWEKAISKQSNDKAKFSTVRYMAGVLAPLRCINLEKRPDDLTPREDLPTWQIYYQKLASGEKHDKPSPVPEIIISVAHLLSLARLADWSFREELLIVPHSGSSEKLINPFAHLGFKYLFCDFLTKNPGHFWFVPGQSALLLESAHRLIRQLYNEFDQAPHESDTSEFDRTAHIIMPLWASLIVGRNMERLGMQGAEAFVEEPKGAQKVIWAENLDVYRRELPVSSEKIRHYFSFPKMGLSGMDRLLDVSLLKYLDGVIPKALPESLIQADLITDDYEKRHRNWRNQLTFESTGLFAKTEKPKQTEKQKQKQKKWLQWSLIYKNQKHFDHKNTPRFLFDFLTALVLEMGEAKKLHMVDAWLSREANLSDRMVSLVKFALTRAAWLEPKIMAKSFNGSWLSKAPKLSKELHAALSPLLDSPDQIKNLPREVRANMTPRSDQK